MSNYDTATAITIASRSGIAGTVLGALIPLVPAFLPAIFVLLVVMRRIALSIMAGAATAIISPAYTTSSSSELWREAVDSAYEGWNLIKAGEWQIIWHDWQLAVIVAGIGAIIAMWDPPAWVRRLLPIKDPRPEVAWRQRRRPGYLGAVAFHCAARLTFAAVVFPLCALSILLVEPVFKVPHDVNTLFYVTRQPWLPAEEITTESGEILVGYTLATNDGWFVVLQESNRTIRYVPAADVAERRVCALANDLNTFDSLPLWRPPQAQLPNTNEYNCDIGSP